MSKVRGENATVQRAKKFWRLRTSAAYTEVAGDVAKRVRPGSGLCLLNRVRGGTERAPRDSRPGRPERRVSARTEGAGAPAGPSRAALAYIIIIINRCTQQRVLIISRAYDAAAAETVESARKVSRTKCLGRKNVLIIFGKIYIIYVQGDFPTLLDPLSAEKLLKFGFLTCEMSRELCFP